MQVYEIEADSERRSRKYEEWSAVSKFENKNRRKANGKLKKDEINFKGEDRNDKWRQLN